MTSSVSEEQLSAAVEGAKRIIRVEIDAKIQELDVKLEQLKSSQESHSGETARLQGSADATAAQVVQHDAAFVFLGQRVASAES